MRPHRVQNLGGGVPLGGYYCNPLQDVKGFVWSISDYTGFYREYKDFIGLNRI